MSAPADVLYLALEDNERRLKDRLTTLLAGDRPLPEKLHFALEWPRLDQGGLQKIDQWLTEHPDARLVVIDTLAKMRKKQSGNSNLYADDYEVGSELKQLSDKHHVAVVLVTHVRKAESQDPLEMVTGTLGLVGGMDGILVLKRARGEGTATLYVTGRDVPEDKYYGLIWNKDTCRWTIEGSAKDLQMSEARKEIVSLLGREKRPMAAKEIADTLGRKLDATRRLLPDMVHDEVVDQIKEGQRWLYVHPLHAGVQPAPAAHSGATPTNAPTPPTLLSHGGVLGRARDAARATEALSATRGVGVRGGGPASAETGGSSVSPGSGGSPVTPVPEFSKSFEIPPS